MQGSKGTMGDKGVVGPNGAKGSAGMAGPSGDRGNTNFAVTGRERLIQSDSSARFCFELSGNSN